jgi:hypothetical protein
MRNRLGDDLGATVEALLAEIVGQLIPIDAFWEAREVFHVCGGCELTACKACQLRFNSSTLRLLSSSCIDRQPMDSRRYFDDIRNATI